MGNNQTKSSTPIQLNEDEKSCCERPNGAGREQMRCSRNLAPHQRPVSSQCGHSSVSVNAPTNVPQNCAVYARPDTRPVSSRCSQ